MSDRRKERSWCIHCPKRNRASEKHCSLKPDCFSASSENRLPCFAGGEKVVWIIVEPGNSMAGSAFCGEFLPVGLVARFFREFRSPGFFEPTLCQRPVVLPLALCALFSPFISSPSAGISWGASVALLHTLTPSLVPFLVPSPTSLPFYLPVGRLVSVLCSGRSGV